MDKLDSIISHDLVQTTINYLAEKPYREVHQLLQALVNLKAVEVDTKDTDNGR